jgi:hypothetical protein
MSDSIWLSCATTLAASASTIPVSRSILSSIVIWYVYYSISGWTNACLRPRLEKPFVDQRGTEVHRQPARIARRGKSLEHFLINHRP